MRFVYNDREVFVFSRVNVTNTGIADQFDSGIQSIIFAIVNEYGKIVIFTRLCLQQSKLRNQNEKISLSVIPYSITVCALPPV